MADRLGTDGHAFEQRLDLINTAAGAVALVAQQLIGRAGCVAEAAVNAGAQDGLGFRAIVSRKDFRTQHRAHVRTPRGRSPH